MKLASRLFLFSIVINYLFVTFSSYIPLIKDKLEHTFSELEHLQHVHRHHGNHHVHEEIEKASVDKKQKENKEEKKGNKDNKIKGYLLSNKKSIIHKADADKKMIFTPSNFTSNFLEQEYRPPQKAI